VEEKAVHLRVDRKKKAMKKQGTRNNLQQHTCPILSHSCDLLPPARSHLLKFPEPPKITPPPEKKTFNT
jgi:hypothetical protein